MLRSSIRFFRNFVFAALVLAVSAVASISQAAEPQEAIVFARGESGYFGYRIPSIIATQEGTLLAFAEARRDDLRDDGKIDLVLKRSFDGGKTWGAMQTVHAEGEETIGNPCPVIDQRNGRIWLPFCRNNREVFVTYSDDDGATWATPRNITQEVKKPNWRWYATGPGVGIQMSDGRLVIPSNHTSPGEFVSSTSHIIYSDDGGETWKLGGALPRATPDSPSSNESQVVELDDGRLMMNVRVSSRDPEFQYRGYSHSSDGGMTWTEMAIDRNLIDPTCQGTIVTYPKRADGSGGGLVFANAATQDRRRNLTIRVSRDQGKTWPVAKVLDPSWSGYSCLVVLPDGDLGIFYEKGFQTTELAFVRFSPAWLVAE